MVGCQNINIEHLYQLESVLDKYLCRNVLLQNDQWDFICVMSNKGFNVHEIDSLMKIQNLMYNYRPTTFENVILSKVMDDPLK